MKRLLFAVCLLSSVSSLPLQADMVIRCADPQCPLCLSFPGYIAPEKADTREPRRHPEDAPFGRESSLAVVNPVIRSPHQSVLSLRGDWEFAVDPEAVGIKNDWMKPGANWSGLRTMPVPGNWESNGVGEPGISTTWDCKWDHAPTPLRNIYIGSAWYRKNVNIPENWNGKKVWLKIGGVRAQGWFWINGQPVGHVTNYCGSFKFDVTDLVQPGTDAILTALIRNDVPARNGQVSSRHIWGGINRDIELEATPEIRLDNVECFGNFDEKNVKVRLVLGHDIKEKGNKSAVKIDVKTLDQNDPIKPIKNVGSIRKEIVLGNGSVTEAFVVVGLSEFRPWSPESPNLYLAEVSLYGNDGKTITHGWSERFGIKKLEVRNKRFFLNDKPYFLRGYGHDDIHPLTLISPADRDYHRKTLKIARAAGFVYTRQHTYCDIPEYFDAADELGIMIQLELPYYPYNGYHTVESFDFDPKRDLNEAIDHHRRYVSQTTYSMGNEGHLGTPLDNELKTLVHERHPGALAHHNDGGVNTPSNSDFDSPNAWCSPYHTAATSIEPWQPGAFDYVDMPFVAHEYLNLALKFDPRISDRFTGVILPPRPIDRYEKQLTNRGLDRRWGDACLDAGHALQKYYQKAGLESARLDPECDGYSFWGFLDSIIKYGGEDDFTGQGMFNAFREPKINGVTPEQVVRFNGPSTILMTSDLKSPILVAGEKVRLTLIASYFSPNDVKNGNLVWTLKSGNKLLVTGKIGNITLATGDVKKVGEADFTVPECANAEALTFEATLFGSSKPLAVNDWKFWMFPKREKKTLQGVAVTSALFETLAKRYDGLLKAETSEADIVIGKSNEPAVAAALSKGKRVFLIGDAGGPPNVSLGWWWIGDQVGTAFAKHAAFGDFPHEGFISPLWFRLIKKGIPITADMPFGKMEFLAVGEGRSDYFLYAAQTAADNGTKILLTHGLDLLADTPEGTYLLDQMLDYVRSDAFQPTGKFDVGGYLEEIRLREIALTQMNGWQRTISSPLQYTGDAYITGRGTMRFTFFDKPGDIVWDSLPVAEPADENDQTYTFHWLFGVGFVPDRSLDVALSMNDTLLLEFTANVADRSREFKNGEIELKYRRLVFDGRESTGIMALTVPHSLVEPGKSVRFKLSCAKPGQSESWIGILEK